MTSFRVQRADRPSQVYGRLRALIIRGRLAPGVRLVENVIAARLGVSRTPAREAILRLYREGFLVATSTTRRTELVVAPLTRDDLIDLYRLMAALEGAAARRVDELSLKERKKLAGDLRVLQQLFARAATEKKIDFDKVFDRHNAFHARIVNSCAPPRLRAMIETVRPQVDRYEWVYAPLVGPVYTATFAEHLAIIRAVRAGSGEGAERAMTANWERGAGRLAKLIGEVGSRGDW